MDGRIDLILGAVILTVGIDMDVMFTFKAKLRLCIVQCFVFESCFA